MESANNNVPAGGDASLDELLDSCLDDFDKPVPKEMNVSSSGPGSQSGSASQDQVPNPELNPPDISNWSEEFNQFQNVMDNFLGGGGSDFSDIRNLLGDLNVCPEGTEALEESFMKTIKDLTEGAQNIPQISPDELAGMFSGIDLNEPAAGEADQLPEFMPLMHNVMQKLMSKELLYPSLKEIVEKYPSWLAEKQSSLKTDEYEKYNEQYQLMKAVCDEFEAENESDSEEAKKERFENIIRLMTKIQNCGNPPKDLVSDIGGQNVPIDEHGNLQIPGMPQQCAIM